jgi:hypothetical protein
MVTIKVNVVDGLMLTLMVADVPHRHQLKIFVGVTMLLKDNTEFLFITMLNVEKEQHHFKQS